VEHEKREGERLYSSPGMTGDISSLGNLHGKKNFCREKEREKERERGTERQKSHIWD
jgi:hypothetical protein